MSPVLILIDIQNVYFEDGPYLLDAPIATARNAKLVLDYFRTMNLPIIHVGHEFYAGDESEKAAHSRNIHQIVEPIKGEIVIWKERPNAFWKTDLRSKLEAIGAKQLVICGMMSHMCIDTTVRACKDFDYSVILIEDACTTKDLGFNREILPAKIVHQSFMAALNNTFADVMKVQSFLVIEKRVMNQ